LRLILIRHGETDWNPLGVFVGRTDLPLNANGRAEAEILRPCLQRVVGDGTPDQIFVSPLVRARETASLVLPGQPAKVSELLREYEYGEYEGISSHEVRSNRPGWDIWRDGCPGGEDLPAVAARASRFLEESIHGDETVIVVSHGYLLRVLTALALGLPAEMGRPLLLDTASVSVVAQVRGRRAITLWNVTGRLAC